LFLSMREEETIGRRVPEHSFWGSIERLEFRGSMKGPGVST
jgi:hypothetical protein